MSSRQKIIIIVLVMVVAGVIAILLLTRTPSEKIETTATPQQSTGEITETGIQVTPPSAEPTAPAAGATAGTEGVPNTKRYVLKKLSDVPVTAYWVSSKLDEAFYLTNEGYVMSASADTDTDVSKQEVRGLHRLQNSPSGRNALVSFGDKNTPQWAIFDSEDKVWRPLPSTIVNATWGTTDDELVATVRSAGSSIALVIMDLTKSPYGTKTIVNDFRVNNVTFSTKISGEYPTTEELYIIERPTAFAQSRVWILNLKTKLLTLAISPASGLTLSWGSGNDLIFRFFSPNNFSVLNESFSIIQPFTHITLPQKCDGVASIVYCFVPKDSTLFSGEYSLPDDYFMKKVFTSDDLYLFNLDTGDDTLILSGGGGTTPEFDAQNVKYIGPSIYFINRYDNHLYSIQKEQ